MEQENKSQQVDIQKKKNRKRTISNLVFLVLVSVLAILIVLQMGEISNISAAFSKIVEGSNYVWLIIAAVLTLLYFGLWPFSQCIFAKALKVKASIGESYLIGCSEHFYNGITPFATGGQPFQIYSYTKRKVSTADATGVVLASFVTFMIVTNAFAIVSLFFWPNIWDGLVVLDKQSWIWVALVGFVINFGVLLFMIALGVSKWLRNFLIKLLTKLAYAKMFHNEKHKLLNKFGNYLVKQIPVFTQYCENAQMAFKQVWNHKLASAFAFVVKIVDMACYYAIPFFLLKAVGFDVGWNQFVLVMFATSFSITAVVWMPTPGGTLGIEYAFMIVIAAVLGQKATDGSGAVVLLWRMLTFYLMILMSFICNAIFEGVATHRMNKENKDNV